MKNTDLRKNNATRVYSNHQRAKVSADYSNPSRKVSKSNKRKNERRPCVVPVESKRGSAFENTQTVDISKSGLGFVSSHSLAFKQRIPIELVFLPEGEPVLVIGEVQWIRPLSGKKKYRVGMTFTNILNGSKSRLDQYFQNKS